MLCEVLSQNGTRSLKMRRQENKNGSPGYYRDGPNEATKQKRQPRLELPFSLTKRAFLTSFQTRDDSCVARRFGSFAIWFVRLTAMPLAHDDSLTRDDFASRGVYWTFTLAVQR